MKSFDGYLKLKLGDSYVLLAGGGHKAINDFLLRSGGQMTGPLTWSGNTALPERSTVDYIVCIDTFADGGTTKWASINTLKTSLGLGSNAYTSTSYLPLSGGTMNDKAVIARSCGSASVSWYQGRLYPIIKTTSYTGYNSILSMKTTNGSWDLGVYVNDTAYLTYITDTDYNANSNTTTYQLTFPKATGTIALTSLIPTKVSWNYDDRYVSSLTTSGNYLRWVKNGSNNDITIPYATTSGSAGYLKKCTWSSTTKTVEAYKAALKASDLPSHTLNWTTIDYNFIHSFNNDTANPEGGGTYSIINISGYLNSSYNQFLVSCHSDMSIGVIGLTNGNWSGVKWLAFTNLIPTVNNASLTLQTAGTTLTTFYANDSTNRTFNVTCANIGAATSDHTHSYLPLAGGWMNDSAQIVWKGINGSTSVYTRMGYYSMGTTDMPTYAKDAHNSTKAFYIMSNGYDAGNDWGGLSIDDEGVSIFGAGDAGSNFTGVFRVFNEDSFDSGPQFIVTKGSGAITKLSHTALRFISNIETGTQPYACTSTTVNTNLNADLLDGKHASDFALSSHTHDSTYAKLAAHNNLTASGNEFTFASSAFSGSIWINYRTAGGINGNITGYNFGDGKGGNLASITSGTFNGNCTGSAGSVAWSNVTGKTTAVFEENNTWLTPARVQILRKDTTVYTDRSCIGTTNGNLHIDAYKGKHLYLNYYSSAGSIYFNGSTYYINGGYYNGTAAAANHATSATSAGSATYCLRFSREKSTYDASEITTGMISNYGSAGYWVNAPSGMSYGSILSLCSVNYDTASLGMQLAWDTEHNNAAGTRYLWFRTGNNLGWSSNWRRIATDSDLNSYLPLSGGTMTGNITMGANSIVFNQNTTSSWNVAANTGITLLNTVGTASTGAPGTYYVGLSVSGYYGFQLSTYGGGGRLLFRNTKRGEYPSWSEIAYLSDIPSSLPASGGNADTVDNFHASGLTKFYLSPMSASAPADSAKSWFTGTMPAASGAIVYNVSGSEKTIIVGKSSGAYGHMLQIGYDDNYLRLLRYQAGSWKTTDWEKISAGYADYSGYSNKVLGSYTTNGGQLNPNYFGTNRVGFLMMNTTVNNNSLYKDWVIMDCYSGNDVGGGVAIGVNRQALGAYIMRSASARTSWEEKAELCGTHNSSVSLSGSTLTVKIAGTSQSLTNTWRGILNNLTSTSATDSLSAYLGYLLANGSARDNTKIPLFRYGTTGSTTKIKININSTTSWMLCFTVTLYQGYRATKIMISGYQYGSNYWYLPEARILGDSDGTETINVYFGYDAATKLWVGFDGGSYTGVSINDVTNGFYQISDFSDLFTISSVSSLATLQTTVTAASKANYANSAGSVAWGNVSGKPDTFTPSSHTHNYLPLSGGNLTGLLSVRNIANNAPGSYSDGAMQIREYNYGGALSVTWGNAPRLTWHWSGRAAAQIGLSENGWLYEAPQTGTSFYRIVCETGTWSINVTGSAGSVAWANVSGKPTLLGAINYNNDSNSTYQVLWGSGNACYGTAGIYVNPYYNYIYATSFYTTSDRSKKQNISSFSEHIRKFQMKDTEKWHYGVIAQEVEEMFRDGEEGNMTVNYNSVLSYYVGCLENKVAKLEEKIRELENK